MGRLARCDLRWRARGRHNTTARPKGPRDSKDEQGHPPGDGTLVPESVCAFAMPWNQASSRPDRAPRGVRTAGCAELRLLLTERQAGSLLGHGGQRLRQTAEVTGASIIIPHRSSSPHRFAVVWGSPDVCLAAFRPRVS